jgi:hypothetical protein
LFRFRASLRDSGEYVKRAAEILAPFYLRFSLTHSKAGCIAQIFAANTPRIGAGELHRNENLLNPTFESVSRLAVSLRAPATTPLRWHPFAFTHFADQFPTVGLDLLLCDRGM